MEKKNWLSLYLGQVGRWQALHLLPRFLYANMSPRMSIDDCRCGGLPTLYWIRSPITDHITLSFDDYDWPLVILLLRVVFPGG